MQNVGENENGQVNSICDMIFMLGGLRAAVFCFDFFLLRKVMRVPVDRMKTAKALAADGFLLSGPIFYAS